MRRDFTENTFLSALINKCYWVQARSAHCVCMCLTLCDPMDCSPPGSSVHAILQARILEWAAMPSFRGSSRPRDRAHMPYVSCTGHSLHERLINPRDKLFKPRNTTLFSKLADQEDGRLMSHNKHIVRAWMPDSFTDQRWREVRKQSKKTIEFWQISPQAGGMC